MQLKKTCFFFALPAVITLFVGLVVSMLYAADSIVIKVLALVDQPRSITNFSLQNFTGLFLVINGFIILITSQIMLGKFYSSSVVIRNNHQLITHGIYR